MRKLFLTLLIGYPAVAILFTAVGYALAGMSFRQEVWVDYHSGARKTTCSLYPYMISTESQSDAFRKIFGRSPDNDAEWVRVDCRHLTTGLDAESISEGEQLVQAENRLVLYLLRDEAVSRRAAVLADGFYDALRTGGIDGASNYSERLYYSSEHGIDGGGKVPATKSM